MSSNAPNRSLSGKRLTIVLMIVLLSTGGLFYWVTTSYSVYNAARRQTDRNWRELATLLESRYRTVDVRLSAAEQPAIDTALVEQWRSARDQFTGTGISGLQMDSAVKVEAVLSQLPETVVAATEPSEELKSAIAKYDQSAIAQRAIGKTAGSRLLKVMLNLPDPKDFEVHDGF